MVVQFVNVTLFSERDSLSFSVMWSGHADAERMLVMLMSVSVCVPVFRERSAVVNGVIVSSPVKLRWVSVVCVADTA